MEIVIQFKCLFHWRGVTGGVKENQWFFTLSYSLTNFHCFSLYPTPIRSPPPPPPPQTPTSLLQILWKNLMRFIGRKENMDFGLGRKKIADSFQQHLQQQQQNSRPHVSGKTSIIIFQVSHNWAYVLIGTVVLEPNIVAEKNEWLDRGKYWWMDGLMADKEAD